MSTEPTTAGLFDRDLDAWPVASGPDRALLPPRDRLGRVALIVLASLVALVLTDLSLIWLLPSNPFREGWRHPWLLLEMLFMDFMIGLGVGAGVGVALTRLLLPDARLLRPPAWFAPGKPGPASSAPGLKASLSQPARREPAQTRLLLGGITLLIVAPIVFMTIMPACYILLSGGIRVDPAAPDWTAGVSLAVSGCLTLGLAALIVVRMRRGRSQPTPRPPA